MTKSEMTLMVGLSCAVFCALSSAAAEAGAAVFQPGDTTVQLPEPTPANELQLVAQAWNWNAASVSAKDFDGNLVAGGLVFGNVYAPPAFPQFQDGDADTLQGLFKWRGEQLDPVQDASIPAGYYLPTCRLQVEVVLVGGNCPGSFGWYNIDDPSSQTPPADADIHEIFPLNEATVMRCVFTTALGGPMTAGFCPLAWDNRVPVDLSQKAWQRVPADLSYIATSPDYTGHYIGFAYHGGRAQSCEQSKYSLPTHNLVT